MNVASFARGLAPEDSDESPGAAGYRKLIDGLALELDQRRGIATRALGRRRV